MPEYSMVMVGRDYTLASVITNTALTNGQAAMGFQLPIPQMTLIDRYQVSYDDNFSYLGVLQKHTPEPVQGALRAFGALTGMNLNKLKSVLLQSPELKRHQFIWKLGAKTQQESITIRNICNQFKIGAAPPLRGGMILIYPYIWDIYFEPNYNYMYGFKPCVIESIDVDYAGNGAQPALFWNGAPESVTLTVNFLELEFWVREDYQTWDAGNNAFSELRPTTVQQMFSRNTGPQQQGQTPVILNDGTVGSTGPG
jgi:hypothetical protein